MTPLCVLAVTQSCVHILDAGRLYLEQGFDIAMAAQLATLRLLPKLQKVSSTCILYTH